MSSLGGSLGSLCEYLSETNYGGVPPGPGGYSFKDQGQTACMSAPHSNPLFRRRLQ